MAHDSPLRLSFGGALRTALALVTSKIWTISNVGRWRRAKGFNPWCGSAWAWAPDRGQAIVSERHLVEWVGFSPLSAMVLTAEAAPSGRTPSSASQLFGTTIRVRSIA
jgi:hypothetical protein